MPLTLNRANNPTRFTDVAQQERVRLIIAKAQDRNLSSVLSNSLALEKLIVIVKRRKTQRLNRDGAAGARGADNSEVVGSSPTSGSV